MIALGDTTSGPTNSVEIIDLASSEFSCNDFPAYPNAIKKAKGELSLHQIPLICDQNTNECKTFENGDWRSFGSMTEAEYDLVIIKSPSGYDTKLFISNSQSLDTLKKDGFEKAHVKLPIDIAYYCMILLNSTSIIVIGGHQNSSYLANTQILSIDNMQWSNGPQLSVSRSFHSCAKIAKNSLETEQSIIVAGGWIANDEYFSTVEILDDGSSQWRKGPELPFPICCSAMVEHPSGGVILIGGKRDSSTYLDTIFHLPHAGEDAKWEELPKKLKIGRSHHTAFLVPDAVADSC